MKIKAFKKLLQKKYYLTDSVFTMASISTDRAYCLYFYVKITKYEKNPKGNYVEYSVYLQLVEKPEEEWFIKKRFSDFLSLDIEMRRVTKASLPTLPGKGLMLNEKALTDRKKGLEDYLTIILNEKVYFNSLLFEFIELSKDHYDFFLSTDIQAESKIKARRAHIQNTFLMVSDVDNQPFVAYTLELTEFGDKNFIKEVS